MKAFKRVWFVLRKTGALKTFLGFISLCLVASILLKHIDPGIKTIGDGIWYCFVASTTIGFGDIYATTTLGRCITILVSLCGIFVFAMMTGVVVSYYMEYLNNRKEETVSVFLEKLENLENLSKRELKEISDKVKKIR